MLTTRYHLGLPRMTGIDTSVGASRVARGSADDHEPLDRRHLARFTLGNVELEREVLGLFASEAPSYMGRLGGAQSAREFIEAAHTLKGAARAVGAMRVAAAGEHLERLAKAAGFDLERARSSGELEPHWTDLARALEEALAAIAANARFVPVEVDPPAPAGPPP